MFILEIIKELDKNKIPYAIVGGYALAFHGAVRATVDVDLVIKLSLSQLEAIEKTLKEMGLQSRLPLNAKEVHQFRQEYIKNRNLIAWSFVDYKNPTRILDILLTEDLNRIKVESVSIGGYKVKIASLEDLKKMKEKSKRPQDLLDIENINRLLEEKNGSKKS